MHTIKLQVADSIYPQMIDILNKLNQKEVQIIEDKKDNNIISSNTSKDFLSDFKKGVKTIKKIKNGQYNTSNLTQGSLLNVINSL